MNREILFKAKRIDNGEWVEGYYWTNLLGNYFIRIVQEATGKFVIEDVEIDPDTLCQYTGLTDKNGRKIFDRDILFYEETLKFTDDEGKFAKRKQEKHIAYVQWSKVFMNWRVKNLTSYSSSLGHVSRESALVIGNYYDNQNIIDAIEVNFESDLLIKIIDKVK